MCCRVTPSSLNTHSLASRTLDFPLFLSYFPLSCWLLSFLDLCPWNSHAVISPDVSLKKLISAADFQMYKPSTAYPYKPAPPSSCSLMLLLGQPISISNQYVQPRTPKFAWPPVLLLPFKAVPRCQGLRPPPGCITVSSSFHPHLAHQQISWF